MRLEDIKVYCLNKWRAYEDYPFGDMPICYKLNGKFLHRFIRTRKTSRLL